MATESAVTPEGCHPFSVGPDQCLVHNGSFANHATIRRELRARRASCSTPRTTPRSAPGSSPPGWPQGDDLEKALRLLCERFDGFYTLLVTSADGFAVVRDAIACKPAVIAETDRLGGDGLGVPRAGRAARHRATPGSSSPSRRRSTHGSGDGGDRPSSLADSESRAS